MVNSARVFTRRRERLVDEIQAQGISDQRVLDAMSRVPRELFVDGALQHRAYEDLALPIGLRQTISQPSTVAYQTMLLDAKPGDSVLEIGTGSGYQAAVLCEMGVRVYSVERHEGLYERAKSILSQLNYRALLRVGDGAMGWPSLAPFDGILVTAGALEVPKNLLYQLREPSEHSPGGRLIIPIGDRKGQRMTRITRTDEEGYDTEEFGRYSFVPLVSGGTNI
ncbi:MAG: protein-L-isoaspartate(D-aspartate) O-methyltransferase [Bacteroidetes bacterium]|nr:protein-L-isoaspartate(D-aspartate) O-methyltransferase [Bacteroidota bacterium]